MRERVRYIIFLTIAFFSLSTVCYGQSHSLPQPQAQSDPIPPPPPVGLPLPIDDYIPLLLIAGILYGAYKLHRTAKT